jgi:hypothetical protein
MRWLTGSVASFTLFVLAATATFVPLAGAAGVQYLFVWPGAMRWLAVTAAVAAGLVIVHVLLGRGGARSGRWTMPLAWLGVALLGVIPAAPGVGEPAASFGYFLYDLRWWWAGAAATLAAWHLDRQRGGPVTRRLRAIATWSPHARVLLFDAIVFTVVVAAAAASTRYLRFDTGFHGDEPKYVRYCEVWYQGGGFEVSGKKLFDEMPLDASPRVAAIVPLLLRTIGEESRSLVADLRAFAASPRTFQWNRARREEGFVAGKRGGEYQIYQPGASAFFFPGYFLDRYLLATRAGYGNEFPSDMVFSHLTLLFIFGATGVALFRLLRLALESDVLALFWAPVGMLTLPTAAFAFQFYPELPALLLIVLLTTYVWFRADASERVGAAAAGAAAAGLAWFHPRFLLISGLFAIAGFVKTKQRPARSAFALAAAVVYFSIAAFAYRITGSFMPTALWNAPGGEAVLNLLAVPETLLAYALDRTWGLAPHAPILLFALPGLAVMARRSPGLPLFIVTAGLALGVPAAGHTLHAAGGTPGRLIMAAVPLLILPAAVLVRRFWPSIVLRTAFVVVIVLSLEAAITYNWNHYKIAGAMRSAGASGWRPNLAFPVLYGDDWIRSLSNIALLLIVAALIVLATAVAWRRSSRQHDARVANRVPGGWVPAATIAAILLALAVATAFNRDWTHWEYLMDGAAARRRAAHALVNLEQCRLCFATGSAAVDWRWLEPNATETVNIETSVSARTTTIHVVLAGGEDPLRFGRMRAEFGDGSTTPWEGIVGDRRVVHTYEQPGRYPVVVWLQLRNGAMRADRRTVVISGTP